MNNANILIFFETIFFSGLILAWAIWEFLSVSRLQKRNAAEKEKEAREATAQVGENPSGPS